MSQNALNTIYLAGAFILLFASAELVYHKFKVNSEVTRKYVHIATGMLTMFFPFLIANHWLVLMLCISFLIILLASQSLNLLPSINAVDRKTSGSILYPIIVYGCYLVYNESDLLLYYYIPILILAICDPIAALVGGKLNIGKYRAFGKSKTLSGSLGFFIAALITCLLLIMSIEEIPISHAIVVAVIVALVTSIAEAVTYKGFDNLTIPASAIGACLLLNNYFF